MCSVASRIAYVCIYIYLWFRHVSGPGGPPQEGLWERVQSKARIISLGNECTAEMADMAAFVACCIVSPVLAELRQREELFVIR